MAFDYNKLRGKITEVYRTQRSFAKALGVSERTLSLKLNGKIFFAQDEINKALKLLGLEKKQAIEYFFNDKVQ